MKPLQIVLDEAQFKLLVQGKAVSVTGPMCPDIEVRLLLSDIGYDRMLRAILLDEGPDIAVVKS